jgi:YoeB-like toxin of bacterial type II toxin-antitoxin system
MLYPLSYERWCPDSLRHVAPRPCVADASTMEGPPGRRAGPSRALALQARVHGYWSRRITDEHRLVCKVTESEIRVAVPDFCYE